MFLHLRSFSLALLALKDHQQNGGKTLSFSTTRAFSTAAAPLMADVRTVVGDATSTTTTTLHMEGRPVAASKYQALLEWLRSNGAEINEKIELRASSQGDGYGAFVNSDVQADELLFTIPRAACLTLDDATSDAGCGETFSKLIEKAGPGGNTVSMAGYMAKERLVGTASRWRPYFETLPWERGVNAQEHVLFWPDDMVEDLLAGSLCYNEAASLREEVNLSVRVLGPMIGRSIRKANGEDTGSAFSWPWEAKIEASQGPPDGFKEAIRGAFCSLLTRSFQDGEGDEEKLVPLLDLLQHNEQPNVRHAMRKADGTVEVRARTNIAANRELWNQYRSEQEESMPYARFFTRFGFVPGISEPIVDLLRDKSSIFYPQKAEV